MSIFSHITYISLLFVCSLRWFRSFCLLRWLCSVCSLCLLVALYNVDARSAFGVPQHFTCAVDKGNPCGMNLFNGILSQPSNLTIFGVPRVLEWCKKKPSESRVTSVRCQKNRRPRPKFWHRTATHIYFPVCFPHFVYKYFPMFMNMFISMKQHVKMDIIFFKSLSVRWYGKAAAKTKLEQNEVLVRWGFNKTRLQQNNTPRKRNFKRKKRG